MKPAQHCLVWTRWERLHGPGTVPRVVGYEVEGVYGKVAVGEAKWPTSQLAITVLSGEQGQLMC